MASNLKNLKLRRGNFFQIISWFVTFGFAGLFLINMKADITSHLTTDTYTLGYWAPMGQRSFDFPFERMAEQLCVGGYRVIDKTYKVANPIDARGRWLIACTEPRDYK